MTTTPNYGFKIAEGTDTVNLLTQSYPNFTDLDSILKSIELTGITSSVATKAGTVFNIVRTNTDLNVLKFVATANYASGDTFTVDGVSVTATAVDGTALPGGAFVINQTVMALLNGTVLTVLVGGGSVQVDAADVDYDNSGSGLTATDVQAAIDEVLGDIPTGFAASAITYDNTGSGLTATDAQDAIDELADKGKWTLVGTGDTIAVPATYNELKIALTYTAGSPYYNNWTYSFDVIPDMLTYASIIRLFDGYYAGGSAANYAAAFIDTGTGNITKSAFYVDGNNVLTSATMKVYKR